MDRSGATSEQNGAGRRTTRDPLSLSAPTMREIGYRTIDLLVDRLASPAIPPMRRGHPLELGVRIAHDAPDGPRGWDELLSELEENVLTCTSRLAHPRYFAFIPASSTLPGALGDLISSADDRRGRECRAAPADRRGQRRRDQQRGDRPAR